MQIAHVIAMEKDFQPIMIIGHDSTRDIAHILAIHHSSHHHPILHI